MSDEIYEKLIYGDTKFISFAALSEDAYKRTLTLNGLSKTYSMTGWRLGYTAGPLEVIKAMSRLQDHMTSNPVTFAQYAAIAAMGPQSAAAIEKMRVEFEKRARYMADRLRAMKGVECTEPTGAFYCFPDVSAHYGRTIGGMKITGSDGLRQGPAGAGQRRRRPRPAFRLRRQRPPELRHLDGADHQRPRPHGEVAEPVALGRHKLDVNLTGA